MSEVTAFGIQSSTVMVDATHTAVLLRGTLPAGAIATITVPDRHKTYRVTFLDAADGRSGGYARQTADRYQMTMVH